MVGRTGDVVVRRGLHVGELLRHRTVLRLEPATVGGAGCNRRWSGLQPWVERAATVGGAGPPNKKLTSNDYYLLTHYWARLEASISFFLLRSAAISLRFLSISSSILPGKGRGRVRVRVRVRVRMRGSVSVRLRVKVRVRVRVRIRVRLGVRVGVRGG